MAKTDGVTIESLRPTIAELERILQWSFRRLGMDKLYRDKTGLAQELEKVTIVVETTGRRKNLLGHFLCKTAQTAWRTREGDEISEIKISSEHLARDPVAITETIIHEAVHLWCWYLGLKDTSSGGAYHNKVFKEQAELVGLDFEHEGRSIPGHGYGLTKLGDELEEKVRSSLKPKLEAFQIFKDTAPARKAAKPKLALWMCSCPVRLRVAYDTELEATCNDCGMNFEKQN